MPVVVWFSHSKYTHYVYECKILLRMKPMIFHNLIYKISFKNTNQSNSALEQIMIIEYKWHKYSSAFCLELLLQRMINDLHAKATGICQHLKLTDIKLLMHYSVAWITRCHRIQQQLSELRAATFNTATSASHKSISHTAISHLPLNVPHGSNTT